MKYGIISGGSVSTVKYFDAASNGIEDVPIVIVSVLQGGFSYQYLWAYMETVKYIFACLGQEWI